MSEKVNVPYIYYCYGTQVTEVVGFVTRPVKTIIVLVTSRVVGTYFPAIIKREMFPFHFESFHIIEQVPTCRQSSVSVLKLY